MNKLYKAKLPEVGGYDMVAYAKTQKEAERLIQQAYYRFAKHSPADKFTWSRAKEYYCFRCEVIETDTVIYE